MNAPPSTLLAFDLGRKRTGLAFGTMMLSQASPVGVVQAQGDKRFEAFSTYVHTWQPSALVVGVPCHPDGAPNENTQFAKNIAKQLKHKFKLNVFEIDERFSTTEAIGINQSSRLQHKKSQTDVDALSACIILEQFFSEWRIRSLEPI